MHAMIKNIIKNYKKQIEKKTCANTKCISEKLGITPEFEENQNYCKMCLDYYEGWE